MVHMWSLASEEYGMHMQHRVVEYLTKDNSLNHNWDLPPQVSGNIHSIQMLLNPALHT